MHVYLVLVLVQPICPTNTCSHCPKIPNCDAPKTRLLHFGSDLNVLPVPPLDKAAWEPPTMTATTEPKPFCPVVPRRYYDYSYVQSNYAGRVDILIR